jgi:DNA mismatch endonuclease (patch repair protein)
MATSPKSRTEFWLGKFAANQHRDASVTAELEKAGWRVVVIWECETRKPELLAAVMAERILGEGGEPTDRPALRRQ